MIRERLSKIDRIRTSRAGAVLFYGYLVAIVVAGVLIGRTILSNRDAVMQAHRALCGIKGGYQRQIEGIQDFLREHPQGTQDFPRAQILRSYGIAQTELAQLRDITCPTDVPTP